MFLMYTLDPLTNRRKYTMQKTQNGEYTKSAHPARFSPDDRFSRHRIAIKKRHGLLLTQIRMRNQGQTKREERIAEAVGQMEVEEGAGRVAPVKVVEEVAEKAAVAEKKSKKKDKKRR